MDSLFSLLSPQLVLINRLPCKLSTHKSSSLDHNMSMFMINYSLSISINKREAINACDQQNSHHIFIFVLSRIFSYSHMSIFLFKLLLFLINHFSAVKEITIICKMQTQEHKESKGCLNWRSSKLTSSQNWFHNPSTDEKTCQRAGNSLFKRPCSWNYQEWKSNSIKDATGTASLPKIYFSGSGFSNKVFFSQSKGYQQRKDNK